MIFSKLLPVLRDDTARGTPGGMVGDDALAIEQELRARSFPQTDRTSENLHLASARRVISYA